MRITIYAPDVNLSPDINNYLQKKIGRLDKFLPGNKDQQKMPSPEMRVKIERESARESLYKVGAELILPRQVIAVSVQNQDIFGAIDEIKDKLQRELKSHSEKQETIYRRAMRSMKNMRIWPSEFHSKRRRGRK